MLWIKVGSVECGKLVDWSAMFAHFKCSVNF